MPQLSPDSPETHAIDLALAQWRQGDLALDEKWFIHAANPAQALTPESGLADGALQAITSEVEGLVVVTQTCDIVRSCAARPFLEVSPLVRIEPQELANIRRGRRPAYAFIPTLAAECLVAHLDRVMTVEKSVAALWQRIPGCTTDAEARAFAFALARKRARFAFPDDFTMFTGKLQGRLLEKHDRQSSEGRALRALREIRVRAAPSWEAAQVSLTFWFIRDDDEPEIAAQAWDSQLAAWLGLIPPWGRFQQVDGVVTTLDDLTAMDYVESVPLDLDHLSHQADESA